MRRGTATATDCGDAAKDRVTTVRTAHLTCSGRRSVAAATDRDRGGTADRISQTCAWRFRAVIHQTTGAAATTHIGTTATTTSDYEYFNARDALWRQPTRAPHAGERDDAIAISRL